MDQNTPTLSKEEILRYSRHIIIPEVGMDGQLKLKSAKVLLVGIGGLGAPLGMYLAAAGVGTIGLVDFDKVEYSNLQRQVTFNTKDVGRPKVEAAKERLLGINPEIAIIAHETKLTSQNALDVFKEYEIIVDGTDNFPTRYLVNDGCALLGKPNVYGSIFRFDGQVAVFYAKVGPCYRCLYPEPPPPGLVPSCAEGGVLGVLPGIIGALQAIETIKLILKKGENLIGRLIVYDALRMTFKELFIKKDPNCPLCGINKSITRLIDYESFCNEGSPKEPALLEKDMEINVLELKRRLDAGENIFILDVREPFEHEICKITNNLIPLGRLPERIHELNSFLEMVVYCKTGMRSSKAVDFLKKAGFSRVKNLTGGIIAWIEMIDSSMLKY